MKKETVPQVNSAPLNTTGVFVARILPSSQNLQAGLGVGLDVGLDVGLPVGDTVGLVVGNSVGEEVGLGVGEEVGGVVGLGVKSLQQELIKSVFIEIHMSEFSVPNCFKKIEATSQVASFPLISTEASVIIWSSSHKLQGEPGVGLIVGLVVGGSVGIDVGLAVGERVGDVVGFDVGSRVGDAVGDKVGLDVGEGVGGVVGLGVKSLQQELERSAFADVHSSEFSKVFPKKREAIPQVVSNPLNNTGASMVIWPSSHKLQAK